MPKEKRGIVHIVDLVADFPDAPPPPHGRFRSYWDPYTEPDDPNEVENAPDYDDIEEAIEWGRERAPVVIVRINNKFFSAGEQDPRGESLVRWESR